MRRFGWLLVVAGAACSDGRERRLPGSEPPPAESSSSDNGASISSGQGSKKKDATPVDPGKDLGCPPAPGEPGGEVCQASSFQAKPPPLVLYLMIDRSGSMDEITGLGLSKWEALKIAMASFVDAPAVPDLSLGAQFFPQSDSLLCDLDAYAEPAVSLASASSARSALLSAMASTSPSGSTPTGPALAGAVKQARRWASERPKSAVAVVLATDGLPSSCEPLDAAAIAAVAAEGEGGKPSIATFVIGILGPQDHSAGGRATLDAVAAAGGTEEAFLVSPSGNFSDEMATALRGVATRGVQCSLELPSSVDALGDYSKVNVVIESQGCGARPVTYVPKSSLCQGDGWYYDVDPAKGHPQKVLLCPQSCERFRRGDRVTIEVGCEAVGWKVD